MNDSLFDSETTGLRDFVLVGTPLKYCLNLEFGWILEAVYGAWIRAVLSSSLCLGIE